MSGHTPGPWEYETDGGAHNDMRHAIRSAFTDLWIAATYRSGTTPDNEKSPQADAEAAANARLMAAAPDLLEALEECNEFLFCLDELGHATEIDRDLVYLLVGMTRRAIDKAVDKAAQP